MAIADWRCRIAVLLGLWIALPLMSAARAEDPPGDLRQANSMFGKATELSDQGHYDEAEQLYLKVLAIRERLSGPNHQGVAAAALSLGSVFVQQGRLDEAEPLMKRALAINEAALGQGSAAVSVNLNELAGLYEAQGRFAEAIALQARAHEIVTALRGPEHSDVAASLTNLAELNRALGRFAEVEAQYRQALSIFEKAEGKESLNVAIVLANLGEFYRSQKRYPEADPLLSQALEIGERRLGPEHPMLAMGFNYLAELRRAQRRFVEAEAILRRALTIQEVGTRPDHPKIPVTLANLAKLHQDMGDSQAAAGMMSRAVDIWEKRLSRGADARSNAGAAERKQARPFFLQKISLDHQIHLSGGGPGELAARTFETAQIAQTSKAGDAVAGVAARFAAGDNALAAAVRDRQDLNDKWRSLDAAIDAAVSRSPGERDASQETALRTSLRETQERLDRLDARIAREFPAFAELTAPRPARANEILGMLAPDEALLAFLVDADWTWLWALRGDRVELHRVEIGAGQLRNEVAALRQRLDPSFNAALKSFPASRAFELHQKILAPANEILKGARHVFVVPDDSLTSLPLGVLVTDPPADDPESAEDYRKIAWFARDHALTVLPTVGSLRALRHFVREAAARSPYLGIGDPKLDGKPGAVRGLTTGNLFHGRGADPDSIRQLSALPDTANEIRAVAASKGVSDAALLLGDRATEPALRSALKEQFEIIHFATHGLIAGELRGLSEPALVLSPPVKFSADDDGLMTASKIATLSINADWVVLSACNTAAGDGSPDAGGLNGLARAFFYAGARSLLVSHWSVPSAATVALVTGAFDELGKAPGIGRAEALRRSQMAMLGPAGDPRYAHPLFWAPFVLAGEGGAAR